MVKQSCMNYCGDEDCYKCCKQGEPGHDHDRYGNADLLCAMSAP